MTTEEYDREAEAFRKATGLTAPGKDRSPAEGAQNEGEREEAWRAWRAGRRILASKPLAAGTYLAEQAAKAQNELADLRRQLSAMEERAKVAEAGLAGASEHGRLVVDTWQEQLRATEARLATAEAAKEKAERELRIVQDREAAANSGRNEAVMREVAVREALATEKAAREKAEAGLRDTLADFSRADMARVNAEQKAKDLSKALATSQAEVATLRGALERWGLIRCYDTDEQGVDLPGAKEQLRCRCCGAYDKHRKGCELAAALAPNSSEPFLAALRMAAFTIERLMLCDTTRRVVDGGPCLSCKQKADAALSAIEALPGVRK